MDYVRSRAYGTPELLARVLGPNPCKLQEEMLEGHRIPAGSRVCDLGSGRGLTSVMLAREYGFTVYATDLWSDPDDNRAFFEAMGLGREQIVPVRADARALPFARDFFDAVVSTDAYTYWGRDPAYLDAGLLPFVRSGGYLHICVPGLRQDCHDNLPEALLLSWTPAQLACLHDIAWWTRTLQASRDAELLSIRAMDGNEDLWADWLRQDHPVAINDRKAVAAGALRYLNFIAFVLRKK
ncbi:MAG: methyltransferase domain-containing protein [Geminicoccaceae bacterium]